MSAILFLYQEVLRQEIGGRDAVVRAQKPRQLPVVLTQEEVKAVWRGLSGTAWWMASLLYGSGLRLRECRRLRVKDVDVADHQMVLRDGKGEQDRVTVLPLPVNVPVQRHRQDGETLQARDLKAGFGRVYWP